MKSHALFVDDEPMVLSGLRRMLRSLRHDWDLSFVGSGEEALAFLEEHDVAVIVSDMRMPKMDGATLLDAVAKRHPSVARLVLSGHAELDAILRAVRPAHQFFAKPCDPKQLEQALHRINAVRLNPDHDRICKTLGAHHRLPSPAGKIAALDEALSADAVDLERISDLVKSDIAMSIQVLRLVNAAFFGTPTKTVDPAHAVRILGADMLTKLVREVDLFRPADPAVDHGDQAVIKVNEMAVEHIPAIQSATAAQGCQLEATLLAMLSFTGHLAAIEIMEPLDTEATHALSKILLAFWGLEVDGHVLDHAFTATSPMPHQMVIGA